MKNLFYATIAGLLAFTSGLGALDLTTISSDHFAGSGVCAVCHTGLHDATGANVSIDTDWRSTMMANASKDPLWQAKVLSETVRNPEIAGIIEAKCATCHMPMARTEALINGADVVIFQPGFLEPRHGLHELAMDGVSCTICHQIDPGNLGSPESFSGHYLVDELTARPGRRIYGPYPGPPANPMRNAAGFTPTYSEHVRESALCATCHTLYTPVIDGAGKVVGEFPEQTPYLEWQHSSYSRQGEQARSCQDCHMPLASGGVAIANRPPRRLAPRTPFSKHYFVGGNAVMLDVLSLYADRLGLTAPPATLRATRARTLEQLQSRTAEVEILRADIGQSTLTVEVRVRNNTGHKFPTGFPSRRAWVHLVATDNTGTVVFESGSPGEAGAIEGCNADVDPAGLEPHHAVIGSPEEVQVYEVVMKNLRGHVTNTLLEAADRIKDNRLLPDGFVSESAPADIDIVGAAASDPDFVGGSDVITYLIHLPVVGDGYQIRAALLYQTVSYRFWADLLRDAGSQLLAGSEAILDLGRVNVPVVVSEAEGTAQVR